MNEMVPNIRELSFMPHCEICAMASNKTSSKYFILAISHEYEHILSLQSWLDKTYSKYRQQRFEATIKAGELLDELGKIGNNVNQIAKVLNTYKDGKMKREELLVIVSAIKLIGKVKEILEEITEKW